VDIIKENYQGFGLFMKVTGDTTPKLATQEFLNSDKPHK